MSILILWSAGRQPVAEGDETLGIGEENPEITTQQDPCWFGNLTLDTPLNRFLELKCNRKYDYRLPPKLNADEPIMLNISIYVNNMVDLNEADMEYTVEIFLRQHWRDYRLTYEDEIPGVRSLAIPDAFYKDVWVPDTFFRNGKDERTHSVTQENRMFRLFADGHIMFSERITATLWCTVDLSHFPMDDQICNISFETYRYNTDELLMEWTANEPVKIADYNMAMFELVNHTYEIPCLQVYADISYDCLEIQFHFRRRFGYYLTQIYIPSILIVALSWVSFFLDPNSVPARVSLGILTILAMTNQMNAAASDSLPRVSYVKAMDVWITACMSFLFVSVVEFAIVNTMARRPKNVILAHARSTMQTYAAHGALKIKTNQNPQNPASSEPAEMTCTHNGLSWNEINANGVDVSPKDYITALHVDRVSRIFFPLTFLIFNLAYWGYYMNP